MLSLPLECVRLISRVEIFFSFAISLFPMNGIIWNCRGAGGPNFHSLMRDYIRIHHLNFMAILEPRISGSKAEDVCRRIGL